MRLNPNKTALITLDFQAGIFQFCPEAKTIVPNAAKAVAFARQTGYFLIHVGLGFEKGHPEIPSTNAIFSRVKDNDLFVKGSPSAEFIPELVQPGELRIDKQRVGAFSENQLHLILRAQGIENLVLFGISTSGIVLSTLRRAFDLDYRSFVLSDACFDNDEEVHRVLTQKIFPNQATVLTADEFFAQQAS